MTRNPSTMERISFRISWFLRGIPELILMAGCASPVRRCSFPIWVDVMPDEEVDAECRRLGVKRHDNGDFVKDSTTLRGCAPKDRIITNGEEWVGGHELKHHVERNCR